MTIIVIGYHEDSGEPIDGTILFEVASDRDACRHALDWVWHTSKEEVGGWQAFELLPDWGPGREIKPIDSDYVRS